MRAWIGAMVVAATFGCIGSAHATFINFHKAPSDFGLSWVGATDQGNQREIYLNLNTHEDDLDPLDEGIDGAVYTGYLDSSLNLFDQAFYGRHPDHATPNNLQFIAFEDQGSVSSPSETTVVLMADSEHDVDSIDIALGNTLDFNAFKEIWIEWVSTCVEIDEDSIGDWLEIKSHGSEVTIVDVHHQRLDEDDEDSDWYVTNVLARIEPNPYIEEFFFYIPELGGVSGSPDDPLYYYLDTIAIATNCVPEPSTAVVWLLLGAFCLPRGRRRR